MPRTLHERHQARGCAGLDLSLAVCNAVLKHGLTAAELLGILAAEMVKWCNAEVVRSEQTEVRLCMVCNQRLSATETTAVCDSCVPF